MKNLFRSLPVLALVFSMGCGDDFAAVENQPAVAKAAFEILPENVEMLGSINFENSALAERMSELPNMGAGEAQARLNDFLEMTGFDPANDLNRAYVTMNESEKQADFVIYADVDQARMESYIDSEMGSDVSKITINGATVYKANHDNQDGHSAYFSVVNDEMMIASFTRDGIEGMLDRVNDGGSSLASNSEIMSMVDRVQYPNGAWGVAINLDIKEGLTNTELKTSDKNEQQIMEMVRAVGMVENVVFSADISDINDVEFVLDAGVSAEHSSSDAVSLVKGALAAAKVTSSSSPETMEMLDGVRVSDRSGRVVIRGELPQSIAAKIK